MHVCSEQALVDDQVYGFQSVERVQLESLPISQETVFLCYIVQVGIR